MTTQQEFDRQWIRKLAGESRAVHLDDLPMFDLVPFEELLERNGVNTDDLTGEEKLTDLINQTGLFSHLYDLDADEVAK